jgi:hypothetical protein
MISGAYLTVWRIIFYVASIIGMSKKTLFPWPLKGEA